MDSFERDKAIDAVRKAARLCRQVRRTLVTEDTLAKKDRSPVTVADFGSQAVINHLLSVACPSIPMVAEEDASELRAPQNNELLATVHRVVREQVGQIDEAEVLNAIDRGQYNGGSSGCYWTLDPIDGTKGFIRGDQYAIALALIVDGEVVLGIMGCPNLGLVKLGADPDSGCLFVAEKGRGTRVLPLASDGEGVNVHVAPACPVGDLAFCEPYETGHTRHDTCGRIAQRMGITAPPVRLDSQCKYAVVARGEAAIYLRVPTRGDYQEKIWDHAAGMLVVTEAGGRVTDMHGKPLDFSRGRSLVANEGIVATNGHVHDAVLAAVAAVWNERT